MARHRREFVTAPSWGAHCAGVGQRAVATGARWHGFCTSSEREHAESSLDSQGEGDVTPSTRSEVHPASGTTHVVARRRPVSALAARARAHDRPETAERRAAEERPRRGRRRRDLPRARQAADARRRALRVSVADRPEQAALVRGVPARRVDGPSCRGVGEIASNSPRGVVRAVVLSCSTSPKRGTRSPCPRRPAGLSQQAVDTRMHRDRESSNRARQSGPAVVGGCPRRSPDRLGTGPGPAADAGPATPPDVAPPDARSPRPTRVAEDGRVELRPRPRHGAPWLRQRRWLERLQPAGVLLALFSSGWPPAAFGPLVTSKDVAFALDGYCESKLDKCLHRQPSLPRSRTRRRRSRRPMSERPSVTSMVYVADSYCTCRGSPTARLTVARYEATWRPLTRERRARPSRAWPPEPRPSSTTRAPAYTDPVPRAAEGG